MGTEEKGKGFVSGECIWAGVLDSDSAQGRLLDGSRFFRDQKRFRLLISFQSNVYSVLLNYNAEADTYFGRWTVRAEDDSYNADGLCHATLYLSPTDSNDMLLFGQWVEDKTYFWTVRLTVED